MKSWEQFHDWLIFESPNCDAHYQAMQCLRYAGHAWERYVSRLYLEYVEKQR